MTQFLGLPTVALAASTAVLDFNDKEVGMKKLFAHLVWSLRHVHRLSINTRTN